MLVDLFDLVQKLFKHDSGSAFTYVRFTNVGLDIRNVNMDYIVC